MVFKKGDPRPPGSGKKKGSQHKSTEAAREAIARFVDKNTGRLEEWLDRIAEDDPKGAFDCVTKIMEYHLPKIARIEHGGLDGKEEIEHSMTVTFVAGANGD